MEYGGKDHEIQGRLRVKVFGWVATRAQRLWDIVMQIGLVIEWIGGLLHVIAPSLKAI